jgi:hypothetical protein
MTVIAAIDLVAKHCRTIANKRARNEFTEHVYERCRYPNRDFVSLSTVSETEIAGGSDRAEKMVRWGLLTMQPNEP